MSDAADRWARERALFEELLDLEEPERARRIAATSDPGLREAVEKLLALRGEAATFLEQPPMSLAGELLRGGDGADDLPDRIGPYRVLERLGRGGMGDVFLAERADGQFEQRVAIKLLKSGIDTEGVRRRFLQERQVLARLDHPNIARLLDGGTVGGRPYFVMELVEGEPITAYCRDRRVALDERLRLISTCCEAVDVAHRRLVVHRDIKPSNVLVTRNGQVKLLDFGIAKVLSEDDATQFTQAEERVLTPTYAAPEQILGEPVTTATDVYALGTVLYELLTGVLPHRRDTGSAAQLASSVERETVEKPSRAVATGGAGAAALPPRQQARLTALLANDLDAIVLKALRREPERRYAGAAALGEDLRRHMAGLRVEARPDTLGYRSRKFVRRHRAGVAAAALTLLALFAGLVGTTWQARRAEANAKRAQANAQRAERVQAFLIGLFKGSDPDQSGGEKLTARQLLADGTRRIETELAAEPEVQAALYDAVAQIDLNLGALPEAKGLAERSIAERRRVLGDGDAATDLSRLTLAEIRSALADEEAAERDLRSLLPRLVLLHGADGAETLRAKQALAEVLLNRTRNGEAIVLAEELVASRRRNDAGSAKMASSLLLLGLIQENSSRFDDAELSYREAVTLFERTLGPDNPQTAEALWSLAELHAFRGQRAEAGQEFERAIAVERKSLGGNHPLLASTLVDQGSLYVSQRRYAEAEASLMESLGIYRALDLPDAADALRVLGVSLTGQERYPEAERRLEEALALARSGLGPRHQVTFNALGNLGEVLLRRGQLDAAEAALREATEGLESVYGVEAGSRRAPLNAYGEVLRLQGRLDEATALHRKALAIRVKTAGPENPSIPGIRFQLALDLFARPTPENLAETRVLLDQAVLLQRKIDPDDPRLDGMLLASARLARAQKDGDRARRELAETLERLRRHHGEPDPRTREARADLATLSR
jgi:tRNA A-37 threonylcarbamoyl transferase component Bud32